MNKSSIIGKILIKGKLILKSPLLIGDGAGETADNFRDVHVVKNRDGKALYTWNFALRCLARLDDANRFRNCHRNFRRFG